MRVCETSGIFNAYFFTRPALKVFKGLPFLPPTLKFFFPFLCLLSFFRIGTKPISSEVSPFLPSFGSRYSGTCLR